MQCLVLRLLVFKDLLHIDDGKRHAYIPIFILASGHPAIASNSNVVSTSKF